MKPNWVCSLCSMWSSRKFSVKRHIKTIHNDNASLVKYIDYHVGRQNGAYQPSTIPHKNSYDPEKEKNLILRFSKMNIGRKRQD
ncbi:MAG TPA: hypothetical protein VN704_12030 [Verrucomicrobiae bacterium]|nr:hypothetical protein [Verrucomicrobiae bacterium]